MPDYLARHSAEIRIVNCGGDPLQTVIVDRSSA